MLIFVSGTGSKSNNPLPPEIVPSIFSHVRSPRKQKAERIYMVTLKERRHEFTWKKFFDSFDKSTQCLKQLFLSKLRWTINPGSGYPTIHKIASVCASLWTPCRPSLSNSSRVRAICMHGYINARYLSVLLKIYHNNEMNVHYHCYRWTSRFDSMTKNGYEIDIN